MKYLIWQSAIDFFSFIGHFTNVSILFDKIIQSSFRYCLVIMASLSQRLLLEMKNKIDEENNEVMNKSIDEAAEEEIFEDEEEIRNIDKK